MPRARPTLRHRWRRPEDDVAAALAPLPQTRPDCRACSIAEAPDRVRVRLEGHLRTVTLRPRGGVPALEAELHDGTGGVALVWLGRRRIGGIVPGRAIVVEGRIGRSDRARVLYNPRYELLS